MQLSFRIRSCFIIDFFGIVKGTKVAENVREKFLRYVEWIKSGRTSVKFLQILLSTIVAKLRAISCQLTAMNSGVKLQISSTAHYLARVPWFNVLEFILLSQTDY